LLAVQVQQYRAHIELFAIPSAKERLLAAVQAGHFDATVTELATRTNLSHEACYRALRGLYNDGRMVRVGRGNISCYSEDMLIVWTCHQCCGFLLAWASRSRSGQVDLM